MRTSRLGAILLTTILVGACSATAGTAPPPPGGSAVPAEPPGTPAAAIPVSETPADGPTVIDVPHEVVGSASISGDGGSVDADGVRVTVPAGALAAPTTVTVARLGAPFHQSVYGHSEASDVAAVPIGHAYDLGPDGATFDQAVEVRLPYDPAYVPDGTDPARIGVAYFTGTRWAIAGGRADPATHTVAVRLQAFHGELVTTILIGLAIGGAVHGLIKWHYGGEGVSSDPISDKTAAKWITPDDPAVQAAASTATLGGVPLGDARRLAAYLEHNGTSAKPVTLVGPDGATTLQGRWSKAPGSNWQKPGAYLTTGKLAGDCTDVTSALVSVFRNLGYPAKAVFGYVVDKESPHVWGEVLVGGKPYLIDEEGQLQPLAQAVRDLHLIRPDPDDPRAAMWDETGQHPYDSSWWAAGYDVNGTWTGTFTITDMTLDQAAAQKADDAGCSAALLDAMKGKALPLTLTLSADMSGNGTATMTIDVSSIKDSNGKPLPSAPQTLPFTYADNRITFQLQQSNDATGSMSGQVVADAGGVVMKGTTTISGPGFSASGVWSAMPH